MKKTQNTLEKVLNGKYWIIIGILSYLGTSISSIIRSLAQGPLSDNLYISIDWLAACIPYFFFGAILGFIVDWIIAKRQKKKITIPLWAYLTIILWIGSTIIVSIFSKPGLLEPALIIFFPLAFGIFFVGSAFVLLMPDVIEKSLYGKIFFDILYLAIFGVWIYLMIDKKKTWKTARTILLIILFFVMFLGLGGCVKNLI
ncbi:MAG: hypothetical protein ACP5NV_03580 [Candidatus Woesearchaeota archaeon]